MREREEREGGRSRARRVVCLLTPANRPLVPAGYHLLFVRGQALRVLVTRMRYSYARRGYGAAYPLLVRRRICRSYGHIRSRRTNAFEVAMRVYFTPVTRSAMRVSLVLHPWDECRCLFRGSRGGTNRDTARPGRKRRESLHDGNLVPAQGCVLPPDLAVDVRDLYLQGSGTGTCIFWGKSQDGGSGRSEERPGRGAIF